MDVGVRELKAHLSEYLERASKGEVITITDRGRPTAVLAPLPGRSVIDQGIAEGWITPPTVRGLAPSVRRHRAVRSVDEVLLEDRGE
jgi:prevent-host-death family protein